LSHSSPRWHAAGRLWCVTTSSSCVDSQQRMYRDVLYELASVGNLPLPLPSPSSAKRERDSDSPVSLQSSTSASTGSGPPPPQPLQQQQRVSVSPATSSLGGGSSGTPFVDQLYSHSEAFAPQPPQEILSHPPQPQSFAYAHLPTHSDELARVPGHVFQPAGTETWLAPPQAHAHRHQHQQHAATPLYAPTASHQQTSYGTPPGAEVYTSFVAPQMGAPPPPLPAPGPATPGQQQQGGQDAGGGMDIWHTVPSGYECVPFPFSLYSGAGARVVGDWLIGGTGLAG